MSTLRQQTAPATAHAWAVKFGGAQIPFATHAEAKRFVKANQKDIADQRGGTFKAQIVRIGEHGPGKGATH